MKAFHFYLLFLWILAESCSANDNWVKCKPSPGCSIARCDPKPIRWFERTGEIDEFSILCQKEDIAPPVTPVIPVITGPDAQEIEKLRDEMRLLKRRMNQLEATNFNRASEVNYLKASNNQLIREVNELKVFSRGLSTFQPPPPPPPHPAQAPALPTPERSERSTGAFLRASNNRQYKHFLEKTNYEEAEKRCHRIGGRLASTGIRSRNVRKEIKGIFWTDTKSWIGLKLSGRYWSWSDRGRYSSGHTPWAVRSNGEKEPNGSGGYARTVFSSGRLALADASCDSLNTFLCEK